MTVGESVRAGWQEFNVALEKVWNRAARLSIPDKSWELAVVEGQRMVRVFIGNQWWALRLRDAKWSLPRRDIYSRIASGEAAAGELLLYRRSNYEGCVQDSRGTDRRPYELECKTVAWLPREQREKIERPQGTLEAGAHRAELTVWNRRIEEVDIGNLRKAVRANWASFPAQVPTFPSCGQPKLQHKLIQLYFVMGWSCVSIAARYGLTGYKVRAVLNAWKQRAVNAGYIQPIRRPEVTSEWR